jgi:hypothetical protein
LLLHHWRKPLPVCIGLGGLVGLEG